jgi:photosystem II stability/assembly factor-like uncharacterized protein
MRRLTKAAGLGLGLVAAGCHRELEMLPLREQTVYVTDKFYDVQALSKDRAVIVGYGGKAIETRDGGRNWAKMPTGTDLALYSVKFPDPEHGWIVGQDGLVIRTDDGGKTWAPQDSRAEFKDPDGETKRAYLFAIDALDAQHAFAVGDRSMLSRTSDGGKTWTSKQVKMELDLTGGEQLAAADPVFYDVKFLDQKTGWITGEFGKVLRTEDGGETWREQEQSLMGNTYFDLLDLPTMFGIHAKSHTEAVTAGLEAHIARTTDSGKTWAYEPIDGGDVPVVDPLFDIVEFPDGTGWATGAAGEVIKRDPATGWQRAKIGQDVLTWLRAISFSDPQNGWIVGGFGLIFRTTDGGKSWLPSQG